MNKAFTLFAFFSLLAHPLALRAQPASRACSELFLHNGTIATMDARNTMARSVLIRGDRIAAVGTTGGTPKHRACATVIDLHGPIVVPGLIDSHNHIVQISLRPGHGMREIESTFSIAELQQAVRTRTRTLQPGEWITAVGGWAPNQFSERRMPTQAELDAAAPDHPVYLQTGFVGPSVTNTKGRAFFEQRSIAVGPDGSIGMNAPSAAAWNALKSLQTDADRKRGAVDALTFAARAGLTTPDDKGGVWPADTPGARGLAQLGTGAANEVSPFSAYDQLIALGREGTMPVRVRLFFYMRT